MLISELYTPNSVKLNLESETKEELFEELVNFIIEKEHFDNRDEILEKLWIRENKMTTGITPNIAIPHTQLRNIPKSTGILGISREGIDYDSLDGNPVHLIMLLIGDENNPNEHLRTLKNISVLLSNPDFYTKMMNCKTEEEVTEVIIEFEEIGI